ncbi:MAG: molybdopterin-binding protein [Deltaproteobacteria bacterium]|nr:molybdopterin-binding protein [Deltaproteobacteria bacterium]
MKKVRVEEAIGMILAHDITEIIPGKKKEVAFPRGKRIEREDVSKLLDLGKANVYVMDNKNEGVHEDEATVRIAKALMDENMEYLPPREGRVQILSKVDGIFCVDKKGLLKVNMVENVLFSSLPDKYPVRKGDLVAACRIVPLYIKEKSLKKIENLGRKKIIRVFPYRKAKVGLVVTGSEIYNGRIEDGSVIIENKIREMGSEIVGKKLATDDVIMIRDFILELFDQGADIVVTTGGLSVDPDDVTKEGIEATGARVLFYGAPIFPGAMFLLAVYDEKYILGAPACVYYNKYTIFDIIFGRILSGEDMRNIGKKEVASFSYGGLCLSCKVCHYPVCFFGKGLR